MILISKIWKFLEHPFSDSQTIDVLTFYIVILGVLLPILGWYGRQYLMKHPFKMSFYDEEIGYTNKKIIEGIHGLFANKFILDIYLRKELAFEQINIRFVKRNLFSHNYFSSSILKPSLYCWKDVQDKKQIWIEKITDLDIKNSPQMATSNFVDGNDLKGGRYGYYKPLYSCPKGSHLMYEIKLYINPNIKDRWNGYISFEHYRGGSHRSYTRRKIIIRNINLKVTECPQFPKVDP